MNNNVVILAGGSGLRMGADRPKQFLPLGDKPVIYRTIDAFCQLSFPVNIYVVLPPGAEALWETLVSAYSLPQPCHLLTGGLTRFHSVRNALALLPSEGLTAIHDGVRPLVDKNLIERCFTLALEYPAVIPVRKVVESMRQITGKESHPVDRQAYITIQTPQVFHTDILKEAYKQAYLPDFTDDATVVEKIGCPLFFIEGSLQNIKITTPEDLKFASLLVGGDGIS